MSNGCIVKRVSPKTGKVSWAIKYDAGPDPVTGKRRQVFRTVQGAEKDAELALKRALISVADGIHADPTAGTLKTWAEKWLRDHVAPTTSAMTQQRYSELLQLHVLPRLGGVKLQKISPEQVQGLYTFLRKEGKRTRGASAPSGLSEQTLLHVHRVLSQTLKEAVRAQKIARNPCDAVRAPRPSARGTDEGSDVSERINALDQEQVSRLLKGFEGHRFYPLVAIAVATGMRRGEILALRWSDLDFAKGTLRVDRSVEDTKLAGLRVKATKNRSSRRTIGIPSLLVSLLKKEKQARAEALLAAGVALPKDSLIFPADPFEPYSLMPPRGLTRGFAYTAKKLGFPELCFHDLRHTHATLQLAAGMPVNAVAQRLGHSNPVVTLTVYGHVLKRAEEQSVAVAEGMLAGIKV